MIENGGGPRASMPHVLEKSPMVTERAQSNSVITEENVITGQTKGGHPIHKDHFRLLYKIMTHSVTTRDVRERASEAQILQMIPILLRSISVIFFAIFGTKNGSQSTFFPNFFYTKKGAKLKNWISDARPQKILEKRLRKKFFLPKMAVKVLFSQFLAHKKRRLLKI